MTLKEKFRHWLANEMQAFVLLGPKGWLKTQIGGILIGALFVLIPSCAFGAEPTTASLSWKAPELMTDGAVLPKCASQSSTGTCLRSFKVYRGATQAQVQAKTDSRTINDRNATSYEWTGLAPGTHYFAVTALNGDGGESGLSSIGSKVVPAPVPLPPGNFTVQQDTTAYRMRQSVDGFEMVALGQVAPGTPCKPDQSVNGFHAVPRAAVTLTNRFDTLPLVVFAKCG